MKNKDSNSDRVQLRQKAEELLKTGGDSHPLFVAATEADKLKIIHELQVHQIELEMQNEELLYAKEKAELAEEKYSELYDFAPSGYLSMSKKGEILELNFAAARMLGKERLHLIHCNFALFLSEKTRHTFAVFLKNVFTSKGKEICDLTIEKEGNSPIHIHVQGTLSLNNEYSILTLIDITEKKQKELIRNARLRLLTVATNRSLEELLQATLDELELITESSISFYHLLEKDKEILSLKTWSTRTIHNIFKSTDNELYNNISEGGIWLDCIRERRAVVYNDYAYSKHTIGLTDGQVKISRFLAVPVFRGELIVAILGIGNKKIDYTEQDVEMVSELADLIWDVAERKQAEEELKKTLHKLKNLNSTKDTFFKIIAHDLRNPFIGITGLTELMERNLLPIEKKNDFDEYLKFTQMINKSSKAALNLIDNLVQWAKCQSEEISINPQNILIKYLFYNSLPLIHGFAINKNISIEEDITDNGYVKADVSMTDVILRNLLTNAIKFTPKNGKIKLSNKEKNGFIEISITDTGVGISPSHLDKLFRIDSKLSNSGTDDERGSGLGLILCKEFAEKQGGSIWVESELGKGSTFTFTLPQATKTN